MNIVDTEWSDTWQPSDVMVMWARSILKIFSDGATWLLPSSGHVYKINHIDKKLTLVVGESNDERAWHRKNVVTFGRLGYTVVNETPETVSRN
jgi:hypothetical protein